MELSVPWKQVYQQGIEGPSEGVVEVASCDLSLDGSRVSDLIRVLNRKLRSQQVRDGAERKVRFLQLYDIRVDNNRLLEALVSVMDQGCPRLLASTCLVATTVGQVGSLRGGIYVKPLTGKIIPVSCHVSSTVAEIKYYVEELEGIPFDQQRMLFAGHQHEDSQTLSDYCVQHGSTLPLVLMLRGGHIEPRCFANISDGSILVEKEFSAAAPVWRICRKGLNIEGRCKNRACVAYKQLVIHPADFQVFNLMKDGGVKCPMCESKVKPLTCGFYDCAWKFEGVKASDRFFVSSPWRSASGETYHRFDADESSGSIEWESPLILVKPLKEAAAAGLVEAAQTARADHDVVCAICWTGIRSGPVAKSGCGHLFHRGCVEKWSLWSQSKTTLAKCPVCLKMG